MEKLANSSHFLDLSSIDNLRAQAQKDEKGAIKEVAKQFEGIFVQMLMKSMRDANEAFKSDSPFNSQYTAFYEQMRDQQLSQDISGKGVLGLADLMVQQLSPETSSIKPASVLRQDPFSPSIDTITSVKNITHAVQNSADTKSNLVKNDTSAVMGSSMRDKAALDQIVSGKVLPSQVHQQASERFANKEEFIKQLYPHAQKAANKLGTTPEVLIAQSALETGWGKKMVHQSNGEPSNNLFNIKADKSWQGQKAKVSTLEFEQGIPVKQQADFRVYEDMKQSFDDFVSFISNGERYKDALKVAAKPEQFIQALQQAGYATDPKYAQKVMSVMDSIGAGK
ncbi:flagellar assembly peptidoglycan hydrolase FlgJ [Parashewanella spongiae]|uniref:Peptidoglycan hydrolase FlgJ n=1 Tax=Parashewanella spongiae TaxID=342950 RepID=A0A3A6U281_9GAMM|nr:flagellar assembly peptidoglycan hydrolase FlgJ [Parashewanella spongiae]MCL1076614.1 flagellar assembly peptidoglycan hydrolase FlgJ [Parashewanella spongiae]RJY19568.1 flagellar assembly peptidoglycan hydrolase FlgJ [Parashewanella spongiae]